MTYDLCVCFILMVIACTIVPLNLFILQIRDILIKKLDNKKRLEFSLFLYFFN